MRVSFLDIAQRTNEDFIDIMEDTYDELCMEAKRRDGLAKSKMGSKANFNHDEEDGDEVLESGEVEGEGEGEGEEGGNGNGDESKVDGGGKPLTAPTTAKIQIPLIELLPVKDSNPQTRPVLISPLLEGPALAGTPVFA